MLMGHLPFNGNVDGELKRRIMRGDGCLSPHLLRTPSLAASHQSHFTSYTPFAPHAFFTQPTPPLNGSHAGTFSLPEHISEEGRDLVRQMLTTKPEMRIGIHGIRQHAWMRHPANDALLQQGSRSRWARIAYILAIYLPSLSVLTL